MSPVTFKGSSHQLTSVFVERRLAGHIRKRADGSRSTGGYFYTPRGSSRAGSSPMFARLRDCMDYVAVDGYAELNDALAAYHGLAATMPWGAP